MDKERRKPELLAPAGDMEKLRYALHYGADAVYLAGKRFGMRSRAGNFEIDEIREAVKYAHDLGKKVYVTVNITADNEDIDALPEYLKELEAAGVDHLIAADPGVIATIRETIPDMKISVSTQANTRNKKAVEFWKNNGAKRVVLARELGIDNIREIAEANPDVEIETFVHGAMCISQSGRCLLSNYMTGRDANHGDCAQPCRWNYHLVEEKRPGEYYKIEEDERGSYIFNSKDLCLIEKIPELIDAGVASFKIEGRMKSVYYVASIVHAYRQMIDASMEGTATPELGARLKDECAKVSHRDYTTAFYDRPTDERDQNYGTSSYIRSCDYAGLVLDYDDETGLATIEQRNKILTGDTLEILRAGEDDFLTIESAELFDEDGNVIDSTPHAKMIFKLRTPPVRPMDILRKPEA